LLIGIQSQVAGCVWQLNTKLQTLWNGVNAAVKFYVHVTIFYHGLNCMVSVKKTKK